MNIIEFFRKVQNLPLRQRKIILWTIVVLVGFMLFVVWLKITTKRLGEFRGEEAIKQLNLPSFNE